MNDVLKNWIEIKLERICSRITKGGTPTTYGYAFQKEGINFIKVENLNKGTVDLRSISDFISQEAHDFQKKSQLQRGDLLFSIAGTIGETCIVKKEILPANTNQALAIIQGFDWVLLPNFLKFQLDSFVARKVTSKARGGAMNNVSLGDLKNLDVLIPPKPEQRAIVSKIEQLFSELDNGIANLKAAKDKLEIYRQAVLKKAFEGDFTTEYRLNNTGSSERNKWESDNLKNRTTQITKGSTPTTYGYNYLDDGINFIKVENITDGKVDLNRITQFIGEDAHEFQKRSQLAVNDILFSIAGTIGETVILKEEHLPANTNQALAIIRGFEESLLPEYLLYLLRSFVALKVKSKARGGAMNNVSLGDLKKLDILIPPKEEQKVILSEIESRLSVCDNILANIEEGLEKSEALRQSILKQAFEGRLLSEEELETCKKEPDWEPAEQLLERIKNEKLAEA
jgi:restriction endonuclease S subunit